MKHVQLAHCTDFYLNPISKKKQTLFLSGKIQILNHHAISDESTLDKVICPRLCYGNIKIVIAGGHSSKNA